MAHEMRRATAPLEKRSVVALDESYERSDAKRDQPVDFGAPLQVAADLFFALRVPIAETKHKHSKSSTPLRPMRTEPAAKKHDSQCYSIQPQDCAQFRAKSRRSKSETKFTFISQSYQLRQLCLYVSIVLYSSLASSQLVLAYQSQSDQNLNSDSSPLPSASTASSSTAASSCFGGIQTFEKISMSTFENPSSQAGGGGAGSSNAAAFGSGILIQQDDQALTSECVNLCRSQSNCLSFVIDYNKFECKSYATTQQELQHEFDAKYQAARSVNNNTTSGNNNNNNATANADLNLNGYLTSSSSVNFQHLLPSASSNYFEKICLDGIANRNQFNDACGQGRLWIIERVVDSFLDGYVEKEVTNVNNKDECSKLCIFETQFVCRSADYDQHSRLCRLSKEDRRTQPQAMRYASGSDRQYLENQCATPGPSSCVYETRKNVGIISMDALKFSQTIQDCQMRCNQESTFNCRSYSFHQQRCFLSGDDSTSLNSNLIKLPAKQGWQFGEKKCLVELCTKGVFTYEKVTGHTLRSALSTPIDLLVPSAASASASTASSSTLGVPPPPLMMMNGANLDDLDRLQQESSQTKLSHLLPGMLLNPRQAAGGGMNASSLVNTMMMVAANRDHLVEDPLQASSSSMAGRRQQRSASNLAITDHCRHSCDLGYLNCPAFTIDYKNNRCQRLDRNSQGRHHELVAREGFSYYEKICLRVPEIMSMCQDKYWIFERVLGYELAPRLYDRTLKFVQSRRDCEEYCLEEKQFQCRSALYNDETSDCKLSRYDRRLADQEGAYQRNFNPRISYLENQCIRDQGANVLQSCAYEQARDEPAYPTFTEHIEMVPPAQAMASPSPEQDGSQARFQHPANGSLSQQAASKQGPAYCEQLCNDNAKFECHSFGYYPSTAQCFLSGDDSISAPADSASTYSTGFTYYEKKCKVVAPTNYTQSQPTSSPPIDSQPPRTSQPADMNPYFQPPSRRPTGSEFTTTSSTTTSGGGGGSGQPDSQPSSPPEPSIPAPDPYFPERATTTTTTTTSRPNIMIRPTLMGGGSTQRPSMMSHNFEAANQYKCGLGHTFAYQRIPGFEPIGGYLTLLVKNNEQPGIVQECADLCKGAYECRAFVVDYGSNQCYAMLENSSVGLLSLRQTIGKDYFEGFCVADHVLDGGRAAAGSCWNRTWLMDKIVDQAAIGVQPSRVIANSDRVQCRQACLEERLFWCKSAMFDGSSKECKLYSIDRESMAQMRLVFTKGVDFFENQCQISSNTCPYDAIERDTTIVSVTKSVQAKSTFDCEHACNSETGFNCRSYTYLDKYPSLPNLCLLSSDSRSTSQKGSVRSHSRTLYAERNCYFRRPRIPSGASTTMMDQQPAMQPAGAGGGGDPYSLVGGGGGPRIHHQQEHPQANADRADAAGGGGGGYNSVPTGLVPPLPSGGLSPVEMINSYNGPQAGADDLQAIPQGLQACKSHQFTFERTFGYDFRLAQKERAPIAPTIGIAIACQQECLRRADRCQSFVVDYALPYQSCFLIADQVGANKKLLVRSPSSAYFEKVCLPRLGLGEQLESSGQYASPGGGGLHDLQHMDMSPGYSNEPWTPQAPQQPYYLQQQLQLIQAYPSRSCPKLWSFERFVNHNFTAPSDRSADNVFTRAQCETLCLNEASFSCRAATYDYNTKLCRLFKSTRRTVMSQFIDLETNSSVVPPLTVTNPEEAAAAAASSSELHQQVRPASSGRQLMAHTAAAASVATSAEAPNPDLNIDYMENTCAPEPSSCQYRQLYDLFSPYIERINHAVSLSDCQRQCDSERLFSCKSINYDPTTRKCMLVNEDYISLSRGQQQHQHQQQALLPKKNSVYSEKGNCEMVSVQCNSQEMLVAINFDSPFRGRVMAKGNPEQCFLIGDGQTSLQFPIVFGPKCNSRQEGHNTFVNEVVIQQHPVIMTDNDKTVRVMCAFEAPEQTITLKNPSSRDNKTGIDVAGAPSESSRTRHDKQHQFNSVVSNKAAPPSVMLRILDSSGRDASMINLGDDLTLKIQMPIDNGQNSALGIFARNLAARSSNGESLLLIDNDGCPVDHQVFPALEVDPKDGRSLHSTFKAFRFPSSGLVNFEVQIRFCPERCQPVECHRANRMKSYGRRRKRRQAELADAQQLQQQQQQLLKQRTPILQSHVANPIEVVPSTLMKPGKAFQFVRELLLNPGQESSGSSESSSPRSLQDGDQRASTGADQHQTIAAPETPESMTEPSDGFDNPKSSDSVIEPHDANGDPQASAAREPSQPNQGISGADEPQNPVSTTSESEQHQQQQQQQQHQQQPKLQSPFEKNILMHVDERIVPATHTISNHLSTWGGTANQAAPYGRFGPHLNLDQGQARRTAATSSPDSGDQSNSGIVNAADNNSAELGRPGAETEAGLGFGQANQQQQQPTTTGGFQSSYPEEMTEQAAAAGQSAKDMPLRFSILVGEGQTSSAGSGGWSPGGSKPQIVVTNSTNLDLDHIVVPGKDGQLNQRRATPPGAGEAQDAAGSMGAAGAETSTNSVPGFSETPLFGLPSDQVDKITSSSAGPSISGGKRASYEQTFDAQPSNSVEAEMSIIESNSEHADHHHHHHQQQQQQQQRRNQESGQRHKQHQPPSEAAAASRDCQVDSGNRRLWTIIWTGAFVIAVNICLVIVSLALYFKKVHLRQNHSIVHASSSSSSDCHTNQSERRRRWPSVLLKSKNDLGTTSLNAHEHFFCKLNSKPTNLAAAGSSLEFNWPNLSSSSSHSTISSIASPLPVSSVRIHQSRPSYKYPFDTQASIRNNFNPGFRSGIMDEDFEINGGGPSRATYTTNIDETHHDMGGVAGVGGQSTRDR